MSVYARIRRTLPSQRKIGGFNSEIPAFLVLELLFGGHVLFSEHVLERILSLVSLTRILSSRLVQDEVTAFCFPPLFHKADFAQIKVPYFASAQTPLRPFKKSNNTLRVKLTVGMSLPPSYSISWYFKAKDLKHGTLIFMYSHKCVEIYSISY